MSSILITGGSGFIGSHLVDALIARGDTITVIDIAPPHAAWGNAQATYLQYDIRDPRLPDIFIEVRPDYVIHLAAHIDDRASVREPVENAEHNIIGTINVLDAARISGVKRVLFASTGVVYGDQQKLPISEETVPSPLTPYAVSKLTGERYAQYFSRQLGLSVCALRLANVYGPRQDGSKECGAIAIFTKNLLAGEVPLLYGDGTTTRDYVHVADVVRAFLCTLASAEQTVMNIGTGVETSTEQLLVAVTKAVGVPYQATARPEVTDRVPHIALACEKAERILGWKAEKMLAEGIKETITWYKEHR